MDVDDKALIDSKGYRSNVGIILLNADNDVFWGKRCGQEAWQFPQGGMYVGETPEQSLFRELWEEVGLESHEVEILGSTQDWLSYRLPKRFLRYHQKPVVFGQIQKWFLLKITADQKQIKLDASGSPEFEDWQWIDYWRPVKEVISFKRKVYIRALKELRPLIFQKSC